MAKEKSVDDKVAMDALKEFARDNLTIGSTLREVIIAEDDNLSIEEFLGRIPPYLRLARRNDR